MSPRKHKKNDTSGTAQDVLDARARLAARFGGKGNKMGGRGTQTVRRRAHKRSTAQDDKKLKSGLRKFNVQPFPDIDEVNLFKDDGTVIHCKKPDGTPQTPLSPPSAGLHAEPYLLHHGRFRDQA
jgi:hypothetical protein